MAASYPHAESPGSLSGLHFIVSHGLEKPDPATRKLIRRHVMRGKKQTKIPINKSQRKNNQEKRKICIKSPYVGLEQVAKMYTPIPERIGSDFSLFGLADEVESSILSNITKGMSPSSPEKPPSSADQSSITCRNEGHIPPHHSNRFPI